MVKVEFTPLRQWDDFCPGSERFARPDTRDVNKWSNRVTSNLLYYQTNYMALLCAALLFVGVLDPLGTLTAVVSWLLLGSLGAGESRALISRFKRRNPAAFAFVSLVAIYVVIFLLGSVRIFMSAFTLPLTLIFAHASFRLRNMKNKLENKMEVVGLKKSPMGLLLEALGQQDKLQKIQSFFEGKLKE